MNDKLEAIKRDALSSIQSAFDIKTLEEARVRFLGKKSELIAAQKSMGRLSPEERPAFGKLVNEVRETVESALADAQKRLSESVLSTKLSAESIDVTLPAKRARIGGRHPVSIVTKQLSDIFLGMGYKIADGPDIEDFYHNFDALNIPETHTAREEADTFYIQGSRVLRTATSTVQVRVMENSKPPIRIIAPGRVFRADTVDATHSPVFHQLEGLVIDENITFGDLKTALAVFAKELLGSDVRVRFRPHYFPFTEPSAEMDVSCFNCDGKGCRICKEQGYIEILGCGMVHPNVLKMSGIDPDIYTGFAFGMGLERIAMRQFGITDMRLLYENDMRFLTQFSVG